MPAVRSDRIRGARRKNFARRMQLLLRTWLCSRKTAIAWWIMDFLDFKAMLKSFDITDKNFIAPLYSQLIDADALGHEGLEFAAAVIKGVAPNDLLEAMLAAQMAVMHRTSMNFVRQVGDWKGSEHQEVAVNTATKLARTFSAQLDALKRYRTGGEQTVTVKHIAVDASGKEAVVRQVT